MATSAVPFNQIQPKAGATTGVPGVGTPTGLNIPVSAAATIANPATAATTNPAAMPGAVPTNTVQSNGINWADGSKTVTGDFKDTYGAGTGTAIAGVLQNMGTVNDSAIQATIANTDLAAGKQYANIQAGEAASGVTANSSTAALAGGDFYSGVNANLQQTIGGMEVNEEDTLLSTLVGEGKEHGTDASTLDSVMQGIGDATTIGGDVIGAATGASAITSAINPSADTGILDAIGGI